LHALPNPAGGLLLRALFPLVAAAEQPSESFAGLVS
jgi:hypothetical protein